jgi:hypothetical protein
MGSAGAGVRRQKSGCGTTDKHRMWMNRDPCGLICATLVYSLIFFSDYNIMAHVIAPWFRGSAVGWFHGLLFNLIALLALLSHARCMFSNPGAVPHNAKPTDPSGWSRQCQKCNQFKPERAHHCSICNRCIIKMDHHCPWMNNCVGLANHKFFMLFLVYTFLLCSYALSLVFYRFWSCLHSSAPECSSSPSAGALVLIVTVVAVMFALFTLCMMIDQSTVIFTNQTQIDRMKVRTRHAHGSHDDDDEDDADAERKPYRLWHNLSEVFGGDAASEGFRITWLLPTPIQYPNPEALTGYCFRDTPRPRTQAEMEMV